jgi:hypothetical protein
MQRTLALFWSSAVLCFAGDASAFCRVTTCNPSQETCAVRNGCIASGNPLYWTGSCVTFGVQQAGSPKHGISAEELSGAVATAFATWLAADCGGGAQPAIEVHDLGPVACDEVEYNSDNGNANVVMFRDERWPYADGGDAYGRTRLVFNPETGQIHDADIELNGAADRVGLDGTDGADLVSILTHEVGHFLGLDHSLEPEAVMRPGYRAGGDSLRTLTPDDVAGICTVYPPGRAVETTSCEPRHGFSSECGDGGGSEAPSEHTRETGCSLARTAPRSDGWTALGLLACALVLARRSARAPC